LSGLDVLGNGVTLTILDDKHGLAPLIGHRKQVAVPPHSAKLAAQIGMVILDLLSRDGINLAWVQEGATLVDTIVDSRTDDGRSPLVQGNGLEDLVKPRAQSNPRC
jgi:hypothetical protein